MQKIQVNASSCYDIFIGSELLKNCGEQIRTVSSADRVVIVTDDRVARLYEPIVRASLQNVGFQTETFVFAHGEASKSHHTLIQLYNFLCDCNITRSDLLVALGGGVVGDLTGFCAATYLRGIAYVQIPTTLLAQIDSSVGGKTAVDTEKGKNLVGAFKQPELVICDTDTLRTLTPEIFSDGMAEAIKYGLIKDASLFDLIATENVKEHPEKMIARCIEIKAQVIEADEFDHGERMLLNFGHTIGHAIERQFHYETYTHGSAVGIGMVMISQLAENRGWTPKGTTEKIKACLLKYQLPVAVQITPEQIYTYSVNDKKRSKNAINLIILDHIGSASIHNMPVQDYKMLLEELSHLGQVVITPSALTGTISVPPSKSYAHRALIAAALANGVSTIHHISFSNDIIATAEALKAIGCRLEWRNGTLTVHGISRPPKNAVIDCGESGSTLRFLIPVTAALGIAAEYHGSGRLPARPLTVYHECMTNKNVVFSKTDGMPFTVNGLLKPGIYELDGKVSSQFVSGLLFALPLLNGDSKIVLKTALESKDYVNMTIATLKLAGIKIQETATGYTVKGNQQYQSFHYTVEGDYSQAAFFLTAGAIGKTVACSGLSHESLQGDKKILDILQLSGAEVIVAHDTVTVSPRPLKAFSVDGSNIPDLVPALSVLAACAKGTSLIHNIGRLKLKESDRIHSTAQMLSALGVLVKETDNSLSVCGSPHLTGGCIDSFNDHRIAMSAAIAAIRADGIVTIKNPDCVKKSYPHFFEDYNKIGGNANVITME